MIKGISTIIADSTTASRIQDGLPSLSMVLYILISCQMTGPIMKINDKNFHFIMGASR